MDKYWQMIVEEVKHKDDLSHPIRFTNVRERSSEAYEAIQTAKPKHRSKDRVRYYLKSLGANSYLTSKEALSVLYRFQGKTYSKVAEAMGVGLRTVEFYLKNVRDKLDCERTSEVLEKLSQTDFESIAATLNVHVRTVEFYIQTLLVKLKNLINEL